MTAQEFIEANVKEEKQDSATVLGLVDKDDYHSWWHIHRDEKLPEDCRVVIAFQ